MCENVAFKNLESLLIILLSLKHYLVSFSRIHKQELFPTIIINLFYNFLDSKLAGRVTVTFPPRLFMRSLE